MYNYKKLGDVADFQKGFAFKSKDFKTEGYNIVKVKDLTDNSVSFDKCDSLSEELAQKHLRYELLEDDIIITTVGSWPSNPASVVGKVVKVPEVTTPSLLNQNTVRIRAKEDITQKYLYYSLKNDKFKDYIVGTAQGSANQASITQRDIKNYDISIPPIEKQVGVETILSLFDDKIENNNAIIANLEEQAQAIFKSWFVDFEPFQDEQFIKSDIGLIPKTGKVVSLDNIAEVIMGVSPKSKTYNNNNIGLPLLNGAADFAENSLKPTRHTSDPKRISQQGDWILCIRGTIGNLAYSDGEYALGRGVAAIRPLEQSCQSIIYHYILLNIKQLKRNATGSVISGLSKTDLTKMKVFIPEKTKLNHISNVLLRILKYQIKLEAINETLSSIRDILLPKLMSGEIRVEETIEVE